LVTDAAILGASKVDLPGWPCEWRESGREGKGCEVRECERKPVSMRAIRQALVLLLSLSFSPPPCLPPAPLSLALALNHPEARHDPVGYDPVVCTLARI
jgi:hypothetical protein